ncbi:hypothetical protein NIES37_30380 [Tolypothrix tenuis PCC 7101]|uniref:Uncharacterized protein n=1 Tax=Tolypothrix tenuis PCC 7101 TaxID=231146 RepID=A0A1Z4N005_9CYAN|nr:hypothetical protein NIES37_30380 [Tolypothrix tenuis PCC 7101]BAZ77020.1 hypothetical protein NIES50_56220 [Aulosira laxa NIES-50]
MGFAIIDFFLAKATLTSAIAAIALAIIDIFLAKATLTSAIAADVKAKVSLTPARVSFAMPTAGYAYAKIDLVEILAGNSLGFFSPLLEFHHNFGVHFPGNGVKVG